MPLKQTLKRYGFSENEADIYLCLLKNVDISAFRIAKETGIPRTTVYHLLDSLLYQGLVSSWKKNNVAYFSAENPKRLLALLEEKHNLISSIMPEMLTLSGTESLNPAVKLYTGSEGIKFVWDDILDTLESKNLREIHAISNAEMFQYFPKYFPGWLKKRERLGVKTHLLLSDSKEAKDPILQSNQYRETRLLPSSSPIRGIMDIYGHKVAFFSLKDNELYSIILESHTISDMLRKFFMSTWNLVGEKGGYE